MQVTLANWRTAPFNRWAFHHVRELVPTADIPNDPARMPSLPFEEVQLEALRIDPDNGEAMGMEGFLRETDTDGMTEETPHILMSLSKSMLGLLIHEIGLDDTRRVSDLIPEVKDSAYRGATIRHLLDMRAGIVWNEDYLASSGPIVEYRKATGWNPLGPGEKPSDLHSFYRTLTKAAPHGG